MYAYTNTPVYMYIHDKYILYQPAQTLFHGSENATLVMPNIPHWKSYNNIQHQTLPSPPQVLYLLFQFLSLLPAVIS